MMHRARGWINNQIVNNQIVNVMSYNNPKTYIQEVEALNALCGNSPKTTPPSGVPVEDTGGNGGE